MAKPSSAARKTVPGAKLAKSRAPDAEHKGKIGKATEEKIERKTDKKLGEKGKTISPKSEHDHVSVRRIANGYMVKHSTTDPKRGYVESEHYSDKAPRIQVK